MAEARPLPPTWLMGLGYLPLGVFGAVMLIVVPQLLASNHVPEQQIAGVTSIALIPGFTSFLLSPLLDWRFSRRTYAVTFAIVGGVCLTGALLCLGNLLLLTALLMLGYYAIALCCAAVGGWFGNIAPAEDKASLGAWFTVANIAGGGLTTVLAAGLIRGLPPGVGAGILGLLVAAAVPLFLLTPCPPADGRLASESFRAFTRDVLGLLRNPTVLWSLLLFMLPAASFALTNTLGGFGAQFGASERMVSLLGGVGLTVAGVVGGLAVPLISRRLPLRPLYLLVGGGGAAFTLLLLLLPHTPATFGLALLGENIFQAAAFSVENAIILRTIGRDNPLASTQFALISAATSLPLAYMQYLDGQGYGLGGVNGSYLVDAMVSGGGVLLLSAIFWAWRRRIPAI